MLRVAFDSGAPSARIEGRIEWDLQSAEREARAVAVLIGSRRVRMRGHGDRRWVIWADRLEANFETLPGTGSFAFDFDGERVSAERISLWQSFARRVGRWLGIRVGELEWHVAARLERFGRKDLERIERVPSVAPPHRRAA